MHVFQIGSTLQLSCVVVVSLFYVVAALGFGFVFSRVASIAVLMLSHSCLAALS